MQVCTPPRLDQRINAAKGSAFQPWLHCAPCHNPMSTPATCFDLETKVRASLQPGPSSLLLPLDKTHRVFSVCRTKDPEVTQSWFLPQRRTTSRASGSLMNEMICLSSFSPHPCCLPGMKVTEIALGEKNEGRGKPALGQILAIRKTEAGRDFVPI